MTIEFRTDERAPRTTREARVVLSSAGRGWRGLEAEFVDIPRGATHVPAAPTHRLGVHFGRAVNADCRCDGRRHRRVRAHGDIDVVPAGLDGVREDDADCTIPRLRIAPELVAAAAGVDASADALVAPRFQLRDPRIEAVAWAIKAELEAEAPSDRLHAESLGLALASRMPQADNRSPGARIGRERARMLLGSDLPMSQIAVEVGFVDQSHMTKHVRRLLGQTPRVIARARN